MPEEIEILRYDLIQHVCWQVSGKNLSPKIVDPLIGDFHDKLDNFRYDSYPFRIAPLAVDTFMAKEINSSKVIGSWMIKWDIVDLDKENSTFRMNNEIKPLITRLIRKMGSEIGMKDYRITIKIVNSRFQGEFKEGIWPDSDDIQSTKAL